MRNIYLAFAVVTLLAACGRDGGNALDGQGTVAQGDQVVELAPAIETGDAFRHPLPEGVILQPPFHARLDKPAPKPDGSAVGRRIEFEYLQGDASAAMAAFATSMDAAGFKSRGPETKDGVVRQVFVKDGYGYVSARAQADAAAKYKHPEAKGYLVAAWPKTDASTAAPVASN